LDRANLPLNTISHILRENQEEVLRRWLDDLHGSIAEDYEQALLTPIGKGVATKLLKLVVGFLESESYREADMLRRAREYAQEVSYRRASVGFSLNDIVATSLSFRRALCATIMNHCNSPKSEQACSMYDAVLAFNRFGDAVLAGEIAGFFEWQGFDDREAVA
jgi:hypothetical protein